jgi:two-component system response regulator PilR (NtrC family)
MKATGVGGETTTKEQNRILLVDDDKDITESLSMVLNSEGYETDVAHSIKEAINKSQEKIYNLAILDIKLPDGEGTTLLKSLRETSPKTAKIMLTGYPMLENALLSLNDGADAYLVKPVDIAKLLEVVKNKIEQQKNAEIMTENNLSAFLKTRKEKLLNELK